MSEINREELKKKLEKLAEHQPGAKKEIETLERLINLAKQSPFASANQDFLDLQQMKLAEKKAMMEFGKLVLEHKDDILGSEK